MMRVDDNLSGYSTLAKIKKKTKRLNQQATCASLRFLISYSSTKIICMSVFSRAYAHQMNNM